MASDSGSVFRAVLAGVRVLVVDDIRDNIDVVTMFLKLHGAEVIQASSVAEARQSLTAALPDVIVTDISMPEEDGFDLLRFVMHLESTTDGKVRKPVPVIALTALVVDAEAQMMTDAGFHAVLCKPFDPDKLITLVAASVGRC